MISGLGLSWKQRLDQLEADALEMVVGLCETCGRDLSELPPVIVLEEAGSCPYCPGCREWQRVILLGEGPGQDYVTPPEGVDYVAIGPIASLFRSILSGHPPKECLLDGPAGTGKTRGIGEIVNSLAWTDPGIRVLLARNKREDFK